MCCVHSLCAGCVGRPKHLPGAERLAGFKARMAQMAQMAEACAEPPPPPGPDSAEGPGPAAGTPTRRLLAFLTRAKTPSPEHVGVAQASAPVHSCHAPCVLTRVLEGAGRSK